MNATLGLFDGHGDVGVVLHPGSAAYDRAEGGNTHVQRRRREHVVHCGCLPVRLEESHRRCDTYGRCFFSRRRRELSSQGCADDPPDSAYAPLPTTRKSIALPLSTFTALRLEANVTSPIVFVRPDWRILWSPNPYEPQAFTEKSQNACGCALLSIVTLHGVPRS